MAFRRRRAEPATPPELTPLSLSESQWRGQQLEAARILVERYCGSSEMPPSLASLDAAVSGWFADDDTRVDVNELVNGVGVALGHHLVATLGFTWVLATDAAGSELAVHRSAGDVLVRPCNLVAERVVDDQRDFVVPVYDELVARIGGTEG